MTISRARSFLLDPHTAVMTAEESCSINKAGRPAALTPYKEIGTTMLAIRLARSHGQGRPLNPTRDLNSSTHPILACIIRDPPSK